MTDRLDNLPTLISLICAFTWLSLLAALTRTQMFGPRIAMITRMIVDILQFFVIYIIQLLAFSLVASMAFVEIKEFNGFYPTVIYLFGASFGSFNLYLFDDLSPQQRYLGQFFIVSFAFVNTLLLLNMVVAMMADTYAAMMETKDGIYNHAILSTVSQFRMSKTYGGLITGMPGLNLINLLFNPLFICIKKRETLRKITGALAILNYMFILPIVVAIFMALNALLLPFAYLRTCFTKINMMRKKRSCNPCGLITWIVLGVPILISYLVLDLVDFMRWSTKMDYDNKTSTRPILKQNFMFLYKVMKIIEESGETVNSKAVIMMVNDLFNIREQIFIAIN